MFLCNELVVVSDDIGHNDVYGDLSKRINFVKYSESDDIYIYESKEKLLAVMTDGAKSMALNMKRIDDMYAKYGEPIFSVHKFYNEIRFSGFLHNEHIYPKQLNIS